MIRDDPVAAEIYKRDMDFLAVQARVLLTMDLDFLSDTISRAESVGAILDPTTYRDGGNERLAQQKALVDAAKEMRRVAEEIVEGAV